MPELKPNRYQYTPETQVYLANEIVSSWDRVMLADYALSKLLEEYETEQAFQDDVEHYVDRLGLDIPEKAPKMTPQMDLSNVDPEVVARAQARAEAEVKSPSGAKYAVYMWKIWLEDAQEYVTPRADLMQHERGIDFDFPTADGAKKSLSLYKLEEEAAADEWVLVKVTYEPVTQ